MKKRRNCFFGLHFDFHANEHTEGIGSEFDGSVLERILREVKPDFVQCDTKGHPGYSSYPTKVGVPAPNIAKDTLRAWRNITEKYQVALYAHYSGILEERAAKDHPEWTAKEADGKPTKAMSTFGEYADRLLIPQLKELALEYRLDGAWVDGECWALPFDWSENAKNAYRKATGKEPPAENKVIVNVEAGGHGANASGEVDEAYADYAAFLRQDFFRYVKHYVDEVKKVAPAFEITSNWMNSPQMPDDVCVTDYISGDYAPDNSVNSARFAGRVISEARRTWDLMAWGFRVRNYEVKTLVQLCQEAAAVVMLGGGFQLYNRQSPVNTVQDEWAIPVWAELAKFCRARQAFCHRALPVHDAAVLYSTKAFYHKKTSLFGTWGNEYPADTQGLLFSALDNGYSTEILLTHNALKRDLSEYSVIAVGNAGAIEEELKNALVEYARCGGHLVVAGPDAIPLFADAVKDVGFSFSDEKVQFSVAANNAEYNLVCPHGKFAGRKEGQWLRVAVGEGKMTFVPFALGTQYDGARSAALRDYANEVFFTPDRKVYVSGSHYVECALMRKDGTDYIHLLNLAGEHNNAAACTFDEIPPLTDIEVTYALPARPKKVIRLPENRPVDFTYKDNKLHFTVDRLEIHSAYQIVSEEK